jgi:hypothetical protein
MHLLGVRILQVGPFEKVAFPFADEQGRARLVNVVHGAGGVGKTTLLQAIAATRPGHAVSAGVAVRETLTESRPPGSPEALKHVACDWFLGDDDPERPHPLRVASPSTQAFGHDDAETARRREQAFYDKVAQKGGFAFLAIASSRWFSRQPVTVMSLARSAVRHELRASPGLDDATRADLARDVKQALAYAEIASRLPSASAPRTGLVMLGEAMREVVGTLLSLAQLSYVGLDPASFEPMFSAHGGSAVPFDLLPSRARHLVAFGALAVRTLWAAYPGVDPRHAEGVVSIDEVCLHQDSPVQAGLAAALHAALPRVQWILTTSSPILAASCDTREVLALRRLPDSHRVELFLGAEARTH